MLENKIIKTIIIMIIFILIFNILTPSIYAFSSNIEDNETLNLLDLDNEVEDEEFDITNDLNDALDDTDDADEDLPEEVDDLLDDTENINDIDSELEEEATDNNIAIEEPENQISIDEYNIESQNLEETSNKEISKIKYSSHIQDYGWENDFSKTDGEISGTEGKSKRLEAIKITLGDSEKILKNASIKYQVHVQDYGWMSWKENGEVAGTIGESKRIEAIKIKLEGLEDYSVLYRTHVQDYGWTKWSYDGEISGTTGESKRIEAIQIQIIEEKYEEFTLNVVNGENTINEYLKNNIHYIFLSKDIDITNLTINYAGNVSKSSFGYLDTVNKKITGNFLNTEKFVITLSSGEIKNVVVMQSDVPSLFINLNNNVTQSTLDSGSKDEKYKASLKIVGAENEEYNITDNNIEIKGRGNTTWALPKKPYQIKLNKKMNLFGIGKDKAKKWVLIANYQDPTLLKNKIQNDLCVNSELSNIPNSKFIDLYINGNYVGNYLLCDKIEVGDGRVELENEDGVLAELDNAYYYEEDFNFKAKYSGNYFTIKEFQDDDLDTETKSNAMSSFKKSLENFEKVLYSENSTWENIKDLIDVESFAKYYLITEFAVNADSYYSSTYFYKDGENDVIHMGPTWDYDAAFGFQNSNAELDYTLEYSTKNYMKELFKYPEFASFVSIIYENNLKQYINNINIKESADEIKKSSIMNSIVWYSEEKYNEKLEELDEWVTRRINYFNKTYYASKYDSNILYSAHIQQNGWESIKTNGTISGTTGQSLRLEGIKIYIGNQVDENISIKYQAHVENIGWQNWVGNGEIAGTTGQNLGLEAIKIKLDNTSKYLIKYRVHVQDYGWMPWCYDGEIAGTTGKSKSIEAIQIELIEIPQNTIAYTTHVQDIGWQKNILNGDIAGTTGKSLRLEGIKINLLNSTENIHIKYSTHIQDIGWQDWKHDGEFSGTEGQSLRLEAIKIELEGTEDYNIKYRVHVQDIGWQDWKQNGEIAGTEGQSLRLEAIQIKLEKK